MRSWLFAFIICFGSSYACTILQETDSYGGKGVVVQLANGLQALLVSNPSLKVSSGALSVSVGSWDDPREIPGMAHFIEHLLFLGSEAYPCESEYMHYIEQWGGACNARTLKDKTIYGFSVRSEALIGALDRFSHFFIDPIFSESAIAREKYAIHHEFEEHLENEFFRLWRVFEEIGDPNHPNNHFSCGNLDSLSDVNQKDVAEWFEKHYQSEAMKLVLFSEKPLAELISLVDCFFSRIPFRGELFVREETGSIIKDSWKGHIVHMNSAVRGRYLSLIWEVPPVFMHIEKRGIFALIEKALNHGFPNSFSEILLDEGLAREAQIEFWKVEKSHGIFQINVLLTPEGVWRYQEVVKRCFETLAFLKEAEVPTILINKLQKPSFLSPHQEAMRIAEGFLDEEVMQITNPAEALADFFKTTVPENCLYFLIAPAKEVNLNCMFQESWIGLSYDVHKIPAEHMDSWGSVSPHPLLGFPLQEAQEVFSEIPVVIQEKIPEPVFIIEDCVSRIRLMESMNKTEDVQAFFCLTPPLLGASLKSSAFYELLVEKVREDMVEGVQFGVEEGKLCVFLQAVKKEAKERFREFFYRLSHIEISEEMFFQIKKNYLDKYPGDPDPIEYATQIKASCFSLPLYYTDMELYKAVADLSYAEYKAFERGALLGVFIEGAFLGSLEQEEALSFWMEIKSVFSFLDWGEQSKKDNFKFSDESKALFYETSRRGNALILVVASNGVAERSYMLQSVLQMILQGEFFSELRTNQQVSYRPHNCVNFLGNNFCHVFSIQSSMCASWDLLKKVDTFLEEFSAKVDQKFSREKVELIRESLIFQFNGKKEREGDQFSRNVACLKSLTYEEIMDAARDIFSMRNRKRLAILVEGSGDILPESVFKESPYFFVNKESFH